MSIPTKEEAVDVAIENAAIDSARYERRIEALLMMWDGVTELRLDIDGKDSHLVNHLVALLKGKGFSARPVKRGTAAKDWWVYFK